MKVTFEPNRLLAHTLSLIDSPYKSYFRGLSIWGTTLNEETEMMDSIVMSTPSLKYLIDISKGETERQLVLELELRRDYFKYIPCDYGHSCHYFKSILFYLIGYDLDTHKLIHERQEEYTHKLNLNPFFLDTLVEDVRFEIGLDQNNNDALTVLRTLTNAQSRDFKTIVTLITFCTYLENLFLSKVNTHTESHRSNLELVSKYRPSSCIDYLRHLNNNISKSLGVPNTETMSALMRLDFNSIRELFTEHDGKGVFHAITSSGNEADTKMLLELFLFISALPNKE